MYLINEGRRSRDCFTVGVSVLGEWGRERSRTERIIMVDYFMYKLEFVNYVILFHDYTNSG